MKMVTQRRFTKFGIQMSDQDLVCEDYLKLFGSTSKTFQSQEYKFPGNHHRHGNQMVRLDLDLQIVLDQIRK